LRTELEARGYRFRSHSDTEVILYAFQEYGIRCLERFNGIFALAIWNARSQELFLARDHFGVKPLYYFSKDSRLAFASEVKALLELPEIPRRINFEALHQYLTFLWVPDPLTLFDGILKLPAGHFARFSEGKLSVEQYWDLQFPSAEHHYSQSEEELAEELRSRLAAAIKGQMISDVPLGAFLSAGLDSSSIVAAMAHTSAQPVRTFTIAFPEQYRRGEVTLDDTAVAKRTATHFGCVHTEIVVEPNVVELLPKLVWHMDEPTSDPAIITAYLVNREARRDVTVLLSGVGGDELFGGYRKYQAHFLAERYRRIPALIRKQMLEPAIAALPSMRGTAAKGYVRLAKKMARSGSLPARERFLMDSVYLSDHQKNELYSAETRRQIGNSDPMRQHRKHFADMAEAEFLNQMLYVDSKTFMVSLNLNYNDKMSMASSVEVRVPFLDRELAEWTAASVPPALKLRNGTTKHILREAVRPWLPPEVLNQRKAGFFAPIDYWLAGELRGMTDDLLSPERIAKRGLFEPNVVARYVREHRDGRQDWSMQIWQLLTLELWMQAFLDPR
jgi:asparagine synthase (glutamine-hydrolysing)